MSGVLDLSLQFDPLELDKQRDPTRTVAEASRHAAEAEAERNGMRLRYPDPREVVTSSAVDALTGADVFLVATRWVTDPH